MQQSKFITDNHMVITFLINDISRICRQIVDQQMRKVGLTRAQWYLLNYIYLYEGITQQELVNILDMSKSAVAHQISTLRAKGWISRDQNESDGRSFRIYLTESKRLIAKKLITLGDMTLVPIVERLNSEEISTVIRVLRNIDLHFESDAKTNKAQEKALKLIAEIKQELEKDAL